MTSAEPSSFTPDQTAAITTRAVSVALSAGAGCGKTFVLTQRFLSHLEPGPNQAELAELVAITFTDRAAREMRDRIRSACRERLRTCDPDEAAHWLNVLYGLDAARITTIHSFCTSLLRAHAVEAGLDPKFTVADAAQTQAYLQRSARGTLHHLLAEQSDDAILLVVEFGLERFQGLLADLVSQRFRIAADALANVSQAACAEAWPRAWRENCVPRLVGALLKSNPCRETRDWLLAHAPKKTSEIFERCRLVRTLLETSPSPDDDPVVWLNSLREAAKVQGGGGKSAWHDPNDHEAVQGLWKTLRDDIDRCLPRIEFAPEQVPFAAELTERASRVAAAAIGDYEAFKRQEGLLDFDDLLLRTRDLLHDSPAVARRLTDGIRLLMVDEFQDTDLVQAEIIRALAGPALKTGKLFLVGDAQQSIYRFRRADPRVFEELSGEIPVTGRLPLHVNFRSQPEILNFVNHLFAGSWEGRYELLTPFRDEQVSPPPTVEFLWATSDAAPAPGPAPLKLSVDDLRSREADWIALRISQLLADGKPSVCRKAADGEAALRRVEQGDIVILFRTLSDVSHYETALAKYGIDYYLVGGKTFYAQQEVFDLLNLCRWLDEPADEISLVGCLRSPFFNLSDDAIHALKRPGRTLTEALALPPPDWLSEHDRQQHRFAAAVLAELRELKDRLPPSELLRSAVERTGYDASLLHEYLGSRKVANLDKLIRQAAEFDDAEHFTLSDYVRELERSVEEQDAEALAATLPEAGGVVRLMTIHQSKGLEFPVVFVADVNRKVQSRTGGALMHPQWGALLRPPDEFGQSREHLGLKIHTRLEEPAEADEIARLLYVATTRAADRLILSAGMTPDLKAESPWMRLIEKRFHLDTGLLKFDAFFGSMSGAEAGRGRVPNVRVHPRPPEAVPRTTTVERQLPLKDLPDLLLADAEPDPLPETVRVYAPTSEWLGAISVSALEQMAAGQQPAWHLPDEVDDEDAPHAAADVIGTAVHHVLQRLKFGDPGGWRDLLADFARRQSFTPEQSAAVIDKAGELIEPFVTSPLAAQLAAAAVLHREIDFLFNWPAGAANPRAMFTGQIDVLLQTRAGNWQLFDYKTGQFPTSVSDAELLAPYALQLGIYALAAERQLARPLESIGLIALRPQVRVLKFAWNDEVRAELICRVDGALQSTG